MILADTSIWVEYLRGRCPQMQLLLESGEIIMHPFVVAELALGSLPHRSRTLAKLDEFRVVNVAQFSAVRRMIEIHRLYSKGIGLTDAHLIASCLITSGTQFWTRDNALESVARMLGVCASLT